VEGTARSPQEGPLCPSDRLGIGDRRRTTHGDRRKGRGQR
jgi:hypothetical protein